MSIPRNSVFASDRPLLGAFLSVKISRLLWNLLSIVLPLGGLMLAAAYLLPPHVFDGVAGYAPLHTILEIFSIIVAAQVFGVGWFGYGDNRESSAVLLACVFLAAAVLDIGHLLSYAGMPDFITENSPHKAILFWFAARYVVLLGLILMIASNSLSRPTRYPKIPILVVTLFLLLVVFWLLLAHGHAFPATYVEGEGLTLFKVAMEYGLIVPYFVCALIMFSRHDRRDDRTYQLMGYASAVFGVSELCFTLYTHVADIFNILGHLYKVFAFKGIAFRYRHLFVFRPGGPVFQGLLSYFLGR